MGTHFFFMSCLSTSGWGFHRQCSRLHLNVFTKVTNVSSLLDYRIKSCLEFIEISGSFLGSLSKVTQP